MGFKELRQAVPVEEFDYQLLVSHLAEYVNKRDAITRLMRDEKIIRIKKGLYIFGPDYRTSLVCKESLANQIYGPSYISLEYALAFYGMIPERVEQITSVTTGRSRKFDTPLGNFSYRYLSIEKYTAGITWKQLDDHHGVMIATPEKALLDYVYFSRGLSNEVPLEHYFYDDLRMDEAILKDLSLDRLMEIAKAFCSGRVNRGVQFIKELHHA